MYSKSLNRLRNTNSKAFILIFLITFSVFVFTSDGHRYTFDEAIAQDQSIRIATLQPHPNYVQGESRLFFEYPSLYPPAANQRQFCANAILCSQASVVHSIAEAPFLVINENLHIITNETKKLSPYDFSDQSYALWRNSLDPNFTFMELFFGPFFSALSVAVLFLVSRTFFSVKTSIIISFLYAFSTLVWAYSQTSLSSVLATFLILLGFLFFRRFQKQFSYKSILLSSIILGLAFLTRLDSILFIIPLFFYFIYEMFFPNHYSDFVRHGKKFIICLCFMAPLFSMYAIHNFIDFVRTTTVDTTYIQGMLGSHAVLAPSIPVHLNSFGLLFSPGVGLLIFAPILFTMFLSFPDFFKRYKLPCILFLALIGCYLLWWSTTTVWHGLIGWGPRYLLPLVPFLILPLGASIEKRTNISFKISLVILGGFGVFFTLVYLIQDVSWFIWGIMGSREGGLYNIGGASDLWISPLVLWTFEYSQLTHSIIQAFTNLDHDIFLLHVFGVGLYSVIVSVIIIPLILFLLRFIKNYSKTSKLVNEKRTIP